MDLNNGTRTITLSNSTYQYGAVSKGGLVIDAANSTGNRVFAMFASNNYSGGTTVRTNAVLEVGNDNALGTSDLTFTNTTGSGIATLRASTLSTNAQQVRTITNNIQLATGSVVTLDTVNSAQNSIGTTNAVALNLVLAGNISGAGGLIKSNTNTVTLRGANSYSGATTVVQGTLVAITNNISSTITSNTIAITFSNVPANGTYAVLPGALAGQTYTATYSNLAPKTATFSTASPASVTVSSADQTTAVSAEFGSATIAVGDTTSVTAIGGDGTGDYQFRQNGGTGLVEISGTGPSQTIRATAEGECMIEVRRLADNNYNASDWFVAGTLIVNPAGNTYNSVGFAAGTENEIAENGLSNLMNYALGQNGPDAPFPAAPVHSTANGQITLTATARTDDLSLKFFGQWTTDLSLNDWEVEEHSTPLTPPDLSFSQTIDPNEPKKFIRFKIEKQ